MREYRECVDLPVAPDIVFEYADDHTKFSSHMNRSSWMMMGGKMRVTTDSGEGKKVGSHIYLEGSVMGISMYVDEVVTEYDKPRVKIWKTVKTKNLMVIGDYTMKIEITPRPSGSSLCVSIQYELPGKFRWIGVWGGKWYATWCVQQMLTGVKNHFRQTP